MSDGGKYYEKWRRLGCMGVFHLGLPGKIKERHLNKMIGKLGKSMDRDPETGQREIEGDFWAVSRLK